MTGVETKPLDLCKSDSVRTSGRTKQVDYAKIATGQGDFQQKKDWDPNASGSRAASNQALMKDVKNLAKRKGYTLKIEILTKCLDILHQFQASENYVKLIEVAAQPSIPVGESQMTQNYV